MFLRHPVQFLIEKATQFAQTRLRHGTRRCQSQSLTATLAGHLAPEFRGQAVGSLREPAGNRLLPAHRPCFARQNEEGSLEGILGVLQTVQHAPAHAYHEVRVALHESTESVLVALTGETFQQLPIAQAVLVAHRGKAAQVSYQGR